MGISERLELTDAQREAILAAQEYLREKGQEITSVVEKFNLTRPRGWQALYVPASPADAYSEVYAWIPSLGAEKKGRDERVILKPDWLPTDLLTKGLFKILNPTKQDVVGLRETLVQSLGKIERLCVYPRGNSWYTPRHEIHVNPRHFKVRG